jgi:hypothetical protein
VLCDVLRAENALPQSQRGFELSANFPTEGHISSHSWLILKSVSAEHGLAVG